MSVPFRAVSGLRRFFSPACAVPRLRVCFYLTAAALGLTLVLTHRLVTREHREARLLAAATHVCQLTARLPVVFVRVPPSRMRAAMKVKHHAHRTPVAAHKEK